MRGIRIDCSILLRHIMGWIILIGGGIAAVGCQPSHPLTGAGLELNPPANWRPVDPKTRLVPGTPLAAWSGPQGSSLVIYTTLPIPGGTADAIAASLANRLTNLPELEVKTQKVVKIGDRPAARVEVVAPGTGDALAPSSVGKPMPSSGKALVATREIVVGLAGSDQTLYLSWTLPESSRDQILPEVEETLAKLRFLPSFGLGGKTSY